MEYTTVVEAIIQKTRNAIGDVALTQARQVEGLEIADDGTLQSDADHDDLTELLETYRSIMKQGADAHARQAVKKLYEEDRSVIELDLPDTILPRDVRADRFASAL